MFVAIPALLLHAAQERDSAPWSYSHLHRWCPHTAGNDWSGIRQRLNAHDAPSLILDVGSFDGSDAISLSVGNLHEVWTFEPTPTKWEGIRARLKELGLDHRIKLIPVAVSNRTGESNFKVVRHDNHRYRAGG